MTSTTASLRRILPAILVSALLLSCGVSKGGVDDATTLSRAELQRALPTADQVGGGYRVDTSEDDDDDDNTTSDAAFEKSCPELQALGLDEADNEKKDSISAEFVAKDGRIISTSFDKTMENFEIDQLDTIVAALNACGTVRYTDDDGTRVAVKLSAERDDSRGDAGIRFSLEIRGKAKGLNFAIESEALIFSLDGIGVQVFAQGSIEQIDLSSIPPDIDKIDVLADIMVANVRAAEG